MAQYQKQVKRVTDQKGAPGYIYTDNEGNQSRIHASEQGAWNDLNDIRRSQPYYDPRLRSKVHSPIKVDHEETTEWEGKAREVVDPKPVTMQERGNRTGLMALGLGPAHPALKEGSALNQGGRDRLYEASDSEPMPDTSPMAQVARESTVNKPSFMGDMRNQGLDTSVGTVGEQPSEEQLGILGRNPALAGINRADEQRTKDAIGDMDATDMAAAEAGKQRSEEVSAQQMDDAARLPGQFARDATADQPKEEVDPASAELAQLNQEANSKNPTKKAKAEKEREGLFAGLSKEETAYAKEELGNYHIDPNSGLAINLDAMQDDGERRANMQMLDYIPEHQRASMLAAWGYIDKEDVKGLPDDPETKKLEMELLNKIKLKTMDIDGKERIIGKEYEGRTSIEKLRIRAASNLAKQHDVAAEKMFGLKADFDEKMQGNEFAHIKDQNKKEIAVRKWLATEHNLTTQKVQNIIKDMNIETKKMDKQAAQYVSDNSRFGNSEVQRIMGYWKDKIATKQIAGNQTLEEIRAASLAEVAEITGASRVEVADMVGMWNGYVSNVQADASTGVAEIRAGATKYVSDNQVKMKTLETDLARQLGMEEVNIKKAWNQVLERHGDGKLGIEKQMADLKEFMGISKTALDQKTEARLLQTVNQLHQREWTKIKDNTAFLNKQLGVTEKLKDRELGIADQKVLLAKHNALYKMYGDAMDTDQWETAAILAKHDGLLGELAPNAEARIRSDARKKASTHGADLDLIQALQDGNYVTKGLKPKDVNAIITKYYDKRANVVSELLNTIKVDEDGNTNLQASMKRWGIPTVKQALRNDDKKIVWDKIVYQNENAYRSAVIQEILNKELNKAYPGLHAGLENRRLRRLFKRDASGKKTGVNTRTGSTDMPSPRDEDMDDLDKETMKELPSTGEAGDIGEVGSGPGFKSDVAPRETVYYKGLSDAHKRRMDLILERHPLAQEGRLNDVQAKDIARMPQKEWESWLRQFPIKRKG